LGLHLRCDLVDGEKRAVAPELTLEVALDVTAEVALELAPERTGGGAVVTVSVAVVIPIVVVVLVIEHHADGARADDGDAGGEREHEPREAGAGDRPRDDEEQVHGAVVDGRHDELVMTAGGNERP